MNMSKLLASRKQGLDSRCGIYLITPEVASDLLSSNAKNRRLGWRKVATLGAAMRTHRWTLTGEAILLDLKGNLYDGQHRLESCVRTGKSFLTVVLFGKWDFKNMGQGKVRSGADVLSIRGVPSSTSISSAIRHILLHDRGLAKGSKDPFVESGTGFKETVNNKMLDWKVITNEETDDFEMKADPRLPELHRILNKAAGNQGSVIPISPAIAVYYLAINHSGVAREEIDHWFYGLMSGDSLSINDPRFQLRKKIEHIRMLMIKARAGHVSSAVVFADICWAWNNRHSQVKSWRRKVGAPLEYITSKTSKKIVMEEDEIAEEATV